jgi:hypothetical protein
MKLKAKHWEVIRELQKGKVVLIDGQYWALGYNQNICKIIAFNRHGKLVFIDNFEGVVYGNSNANSEH